jgi:hypothetical protein
VSRWGDIIRSWGTTADERGRPFPCDSLLPGEVTALFRGVTVNADPAIVFRWLCQLRAAPYSYDWIDNLGRRSPRELTPGLEHLAIGQPVMRIFDLVAFEPDRHLTLLLRRPGLFPPLACSYVVTPLGSDASRLVAKLVFRPSPRLRDRMLQRLLPALDWIMMRRQLLNLKLLSERLAAEQRGAQPRPEPARRPEPR